LTKYHERKAAAEGNPADSEPASFLARSIARESLTISGLDDPADPVQRQQAAMLAGRLHRSLSTFPSYRRQEGAVRNTAATGGPWGWLPLFDDGCSRAGLMFLERGKSVPLHDHPGAVAITLVVTGKIEIIQCDADSEESKRDLTVRWEGRLKAGEATFLTVAAGNIHSFKAVEDCVVFDLFAISYPYEKRSWFIPETTLFSPGGNTQPRRPTPANAARQDYHHTPAN